MSRYGVPFVRGPQVELRPHARSCELNEVSALAKKLKRPLAIDLFCGAGGLSQGLHLAGFDVILAVDIDPEAVATHRAHFPGASVCMDLSDPKSVQKICNTLKGVKLDLVAGGPPCQPYSQAAFSKVRHLQKHHGRKADPRRDLWAPLLTLVKETKPKAVLIENVPDMAYGRDGVVLRRLIDQLEILGYFVDARVLSSDGYGVPQHRQRLFTVAFSEARDFEWPRAEDEDRRVIWDAISDLPIVEGGDRTVCRPYAGTRAESQAYYRKGLPASKRSVIYDHYTRAVRPDDLRAFKLMTSKTKYSDLPAKLKRYRDDIFEDKYKRLDWYELSRTITAHISQDGYWYIHPDQHRTLTIREAARIQTFSDGFRFSGFPRHAFKQIGEAVPPLLGKAVAKSIKVALKKKLSQQRGVTSVQIRSALTRWMVVQRPKTMLQPWLLSKGFWMKCIGHMIFERASPVQVARGFRAVSTRWSTSNAYLKDRNRRRVLRDEGREKMLPVLDKLARQLSKRRIPTIDLLNDAGITGRTAGVLLGIGGRSSRRTVNAPLARLAERFWNRAPTEIDGRGTQEMLLGRMIGEDKAGDSYCALNELAARFCRPTNPQCRFCPLGELCVTGRNRIHESIEDPIASEG